MTLEQLKTAIISFATEVGNDIKALRQSVLDIINDAQTALDATWSSTKISNELSNKVDKVAGKGLSPEEYTLTEKQKLAGLEGSKFRGKFIGEDTTALPTTGNVDGSYADLDTGPGDPIKRYVWDDNDSQWEESTGDSTELTGAQVKSLYEGEPDTNALTDARATKLDNLPADAEKNTITGVKGSAEATYRTGQVSISLANLDAGTDDPLTTYTTARDS